MVLLESVPTKISIRPIPSKADQGRPRQQIVDRFKKLPILAFEMFHLDLFPLVMVLRTRCCLKQQQTNTNTLLSNVNNNLTNTTTNKKK